MEDSLHEVRCQAGDTGVSEELYAVDCLRSRKRMLLQTPRKPQMTERDLTERALRRHLPGRSEAFYAANANAAAELREPENTATRRASVTQPPPGVGNEAVIPPKPVAGNFTMRLELPLPPKVLCSNGRTKNHLFRAREIKKYRTTAMLTALSKLPGGTNTGPRLPRGTVTVTWFHRTAHRFDQSNAAHNLGIKAAIDGFCEANIFESDRFVGVVVLQLTDKLRPRLVLEITAT